MSDQPAPLRRWHAVVESKDPALLDDLLADDVVFRSPAVFAPQEGKALTTSYLSAALKVLGPTLRYVSQWHDHASAVLEFEADLDGVYVAGRGHPALECPGKAGQLHGHGPPAARAAEAGLRAVRQSHFREQREQGALFLRVEVGEQAGGVESRA